MIRGFHSVLVFLLIFQSSAFALTGHESKRERPFMEKIYENFLKGNYSETESLASTYLASNSSFEDAGEVAYLQALSLLKLGRLSEARTKFNLVAQSPRPSPVKAAACASLGDSYFIEKHADLALLWYEEVLQKYPDSDEASYVRDQIRKIGKPAGEAPAKSQEKKFFYTVQVGSFSSERNAKTLIQKLAKSEYDAYLEKDDTGGFFRVRVGHLDRKEDARILESSLKQEGYITRIYP